MCSIGGICFFKPKRPTVDDQKLMKKMMDSTSHRGPDGEGFFTSQKIIFGHRRLAILDLTATGQQPMFNEDKTLAVVFNGEIYNYLELAKELKSLGHKFRSSSDTEVILHAFEEWREKCLSRFNGMWALAIWDCKKQELFCARDRWGVKPFYYHQNTQRFTFASEIKAILEDKKIKKKADYRCLYDFLVFNRLDHQEETFFQGIKRLMPGHWLKINHQGKLTIKRWYEIKSKNLIVSSENPLDFFPRLLEESINLRMRSDVPVGSCLSGGLDSSTIVALIKNINPKVKLKTFSAVFSPIWRGDESCYIQLIKEKFNLQNYQTKPDYQGFLKNLPKLIYHQEEPFGGSSVFASWEVMKLAHKHKIKVLLDGQGADEILAGYPYIAGFYFYELLKNGHFITLLKEIMLFRRKQKYDFYSAIQVLLYKISPKFLQKEILFRSLPWINPKFFKEYRKQSRFADQFFSANTLNESLIMHTRSKLAHLLRYEDKNAMAFGIETRLPFLDFRLVEYALSLRPEMKIKNGETKVLLRQVMNGVLPKEISRRNDKIGFETPEELWFKEKEIVKFIKDVINSKTLQSRGLFNLSLINKMFQNHITGKKNHHHVLWKIICVELWFRIFID